MLDTSSLAKRAAFALKSACDLSDDKSEVVSYSLDLLLSGLLGFFLAFLVGSFFGVGLLTLISMVAGAFVRTFAGGGHCSSANRCATASVFYVVLALLARFLGNNLENHFVTALYIVLLVIAFAVLHLWAPADAANKPILGQNHRARLRLLATITLVVVLFIGFLQPNPAYKLAVFLGVGLQVWSVTPLGRKNVDIFDRFLLRIGIN